jgi:hypothetical protein
VTDDSPAPEILYPHWQKEYQAALIEVDPAKLGGCVDAAETAIYKRLHELSQNSDHHTERQVIEDAAEPSLPEEKGRLTGLSDAIPNISRYRRGCRNLTEPVE